MVKTSLHAHGCGWVHADSLRQAKAERTAERADLAILDLESIDLYALLLLEELKDRPVALFETVWPQSTPLSPNITTLSRPVSERELRIWCRGRAEVLRRTLCRIAS